MTSAITSVKVGDWIRFVRGGQLVIDQVAYIVPRGSWDSTPEVMTIHNGRVIMDCVLEVRKPVHSPETGGQ